MPGKIGISKAILDAEKRKRARRDTSADKKDTTTPTANVGKPFSMQKAAEEGIANSLPAFPRNMGVKFTPKTGPNAGEEVMFRMPPFPRNLSEKQEEKLNEPLKAAIKAKLAKTNNTRVTEDEDSGMLRMEELKPLNRMGSVALQRNEMPMAYRHKVVKKTGVAKAIPFTAK